MDVERLPRIFYWIIIYIELYITLNPSKKVKFSSEKQKDMSDDGIGDSIRFIGE